MILQPFIYTTLLKPLVDDFKIGELSKDRQNDESGLAARAVKEAKKATKEGNPTTANGAFDKLKAKYDKLSI